MLQKTTINRAMLQVLADYCAAATEAMAHTLMRTAHSSFVKETEDFTTQLVTVKGETFASPKGLGATWFTNLDYGPAIRMIEEYEEGAIYLTSDPYSGFVATHAPDVHAWKPVFHNGELVCFVACHVHNTDVGGAVPASLSRSLVEVQQEGIRIPPMKVWQNGEFDRNLLRIIDTNVRMPEQNWGDLNAQVACLNTGEAKVREMIARFGIDVIRACQSELLDYAEAQARSIVSKIPDGEYFFADYADEDSDGGVPCRIAVTLKVKGEDLVLDFTGSDPQLGSSLNMPTGGNPRHALVTIAVILVLSTLEPHLVLNAGTTRLVQSILPEGTVMNAVAPAAVGMRSLGVAVSQLAILGAFQQALPEELAASPGGAASLLNVKTIDRNGRQIMASIGPVSGGGGGGPKKDGVEGSGGNRSFLRNTPVEINEVEVPIHIEKYGLVPDSGGAGKYRGGSAMVMEFQVFSPNSVVTARNRNRTRFASWGVLGGRAGKTSCFVRNPGSQNQQDLGNIDVVRCDPGDVIRITGPGGGGYGNPAERPIEAVVADIQAGFITREGAAADYGVILGSDGRVDEEGTRTARSLFNHAGRFDFGRGRDRYEAVWTKARYDVLTKILMSLPITWRFYVKHRIFEAVSDPVGSGGIKEVLDAYHAIADRHRELPSSIPLT
ncbi:hydantoinase B/oxoprolinase family protein [Rhizobium lentis]|uniref:Hydantoinase B/oxoprolinase family protein n=1 Tax=Rhizobium lentis TaxID=1138194 RepID=A0ABS7ICV6_9HYPH|nr:hydantoinase B/oxoprolinase family protein [Rhizobium lentis]MBX5088337.1 hydantoinase B/oxoprolinase family protein [Rhizobium lentis]